MAIKGFERDNLGDYKTERIQDNAEKFNRQFSKVPFLNGIHLRGITIDGGAISLEVNHKLGRKPIGYLITSMSKPRSISMVSSTEKTILFEVNSTGVSFDVWVF